MPLSISVFVPLIVMAQAADPSPATASPQPANAQAEKLLAAQPAGVPLVADPVDLSQPSAPVWVSRDAPPGDRVFARIRLRPVGGARIEGPAARADQPTVLLRTVTGNDAGTPAEANAKDRPALFCGRAAAAAQSVCFSDRDQDGKFDVLRIGVGGRPGKGEQVEIVGAPEPLPTPIAYRAATPDELPVFDTVIEQCLPDYDLPRFRFGMRPAPGAPPEPMTAILPGMGTFQFDAALAGCETSERAKGSDGMIAARLRDLVIEIGPKKQGAKTRLARFDGEGRLYRFDGATVRRFAGTVTAAQDALAAQQKFPLAPYALTGEANVATGVRAVGDTLATFGFRHGYTGRLTAETKIRTLLTSRSLPAGTLLYGIPMQSSFQTTVNGVPTAGFGPPRPTADNTSLVWCVPVKDEDKWSATCLPNQDGARYTLLKGQTPAFAVTSLRYDAGTSTNDGPVPVAIGPGDFGRPLSYRVRLAGLNADMIKLAIDTMFGDELVSTLDRLVPRMAGRSSAMSVGSQTLLFRPAPDGKVEVSVAGDVRAGETPDFQSGVLRDTP